MINDRARELTAYTSSIGVFTTTITMYYQENERFSYPIWYVNILLTAWYNEDGELNRRPILICKSIEDEKEIDNYVNLPLKNSFIKVKMIEFEDCTQERVRFSDILDYGFEDEKLNEYIVEINRIRHFSDERCGLFLFDPNRGKFVNDVLWGKEIIKLEIDTKDTEEAKNICDAYLNIFYDEKNGIN